MAIEKYFKECIDKKASDLHLIEGSHPTLRIDGVLVSISDQAIPTDFVKKEMYALLSKTMIASFEEELDLDFSYEFFGSRFRINLHRQKGRSAITARLISNTFSSVDDLNFTEAMKNLARLKDGLVLFTGPTGSGKSTSLAAIIQSINSERSAHIITIEDPIEYVFTDNKSIIEQRELGQDTPTFHKALKYTLRQDPDVIMVGEMRDLETISAALTAAETGHVVLSTLHTNTAAETIDRIVDIFPAHQQQQILIQLASSLRAVISQQLIPKPKGGRVAAFEILVNTGAIANLIRTNKSAQIPSTIQTGSRDGMIMMNKSIENLVKDKLIDQATADKYKRSGSTKAMYC
ncbi:MAG: PilT/PilU family type 4a pilus ATPase [Candidatus Falkowbacteria bacterium]|nr:PilT/PilU family type 4a pilus ATPase [Candidatus Falkowbacteria bacterium]